MREWRYGARVAAVATLTGLAIVAQAQQKAEPDRAQEMRKLHWIQGPISYPLGDEATVKLPQDTGAVSGTDSDKFMQLTGNLPEPGMSIVVGEHWWAAFDFDKSGYIKDDEKIDAAALLKQLQDSDGPSNVQRRNQGLPQIYTDGWYITPAYNAQTHNLEWAIRLHSSDHPGPMINYTVRMLGRTGYERAVLVSAPETLDRDVAEFRQLLGGFDFNAGQKYSEFRDGDRVAEYGLAALVAGGAAAVATKTGFWKVLVGALAAGWKLIAAGAVALMAAIGKLFGRKKDPVA